MFLQRLFLRCKNFLFPPRCIFCKRLLRLCTQVGVCNHCMEHLPFCLSYHHCQTCGRPIPEEEVFCNRCGKGYRNSYHKLCAAYLYESAVKGALLRFKQERFQSYAPTLAFHMAMVLKTTLPNLDIDFIVAVPPRKTRLRKDAYDQATTLARALAQQMKLPLLPGVLRQIEDRQKQSSLSYEERWINVAGNYAVVKQRAIEGKRLLLVDDICTTGATLQECSKMLKQSGAQAVWCSVAAVASEENFF